MNKSLLVSVIFLFFASISCVLAQQNSTSKDTEISWHKSGMPEALKLAEKHNRPLFVYWGAVWCPPCNVIKSTLFKDTQFIQATRDYISVYLDGDTDEAQKWGDDLKVMGYPTLMILSPAGKEVLRLSANNPVEDLVKTLNYTKNEWNPLIEILTQVLSEQSIDAQKVRSLAMYSWSQDKEVDEKPEEYSAKLFQLEEKLKNSTFQKERSLFFMRALTLKIKSLKEDEQIEKQQKTQYKNRIEAILNNTELLKANISSLAYEAENQVKQLTEESYNGSSKDRNDLIQLYLQKMQALRHLKGISYDDYYSTFYPAIEFAESFTVKVDERDKKQLIAYTTKHLPLTKDKKSREVMIDTTAYMLFKFGMKKVAEQMLTSELKTTPNPFYLMSTLAYFEKEEGNKDKALDWYEKAYQSAKGPATKLQWYASYVRNLIKLTPEDNQAIKSHVNTLLSDYTHMTDSYWGRNFRVLVSVKKSVNKWAEETEQTDWLKTLKTQGINQCSTSKKEIYKTGCEKFYREFIFNEA